MKLITEGLSFSYGKNAVLKNINLRIKPMVTVIIGPNGAGKSTLIKCMAGLLPANGDILFDDRKVGPAYKEFHTQMMSYLPQVTENYTSLTVFEAVLLGMMNTLSLRVSDEELQKVNQVLTELQIQDLSHRQLNELSGGQQQMVYIAQAIIKNPKVILLDEPLNSLDIHHQFGILDLVSELTYQKKMITVMAMHDLNMAAKYADQIIVMNKGQVYDCGSPRDVLTAEMIRSVYRVESDVNINGNGVPFVNPIQCLSSMSHCMV